MKSKELPYQTSQFILISAYLTWFNGSQSVAVKNNQGCKILWNSWKLIQDFHNGDKKFFTIVSGLAK